ncbi:hypothetical protein MSAN_01528900 [Mycena sanguinolenta]|uniref:F-box domain-containing protein n=1 Tax=Mycena sanguinolenta TaxID=230812 RepID=A0A8H6Y6M5_9AGAR|nr:hypothetical protein MSAN_01528900 [Mycena sanguinolenta]
MPFEALGEDILLRIFCFCDISTILTVSAINKTLRRIALSKQLWLSLVLDPGFRDALDLPPPDREQLECLSTKDLIAVIKNAVIRPCSIWDFEHDESSMSVLTSVSIPLDEDNRDRLQARLLPGARYILLHSTSTTHRRLCMYDVWSARRIWEHLVQVRTMCVVDLVPGCSIARIFFAKSLDYSNPSSPLHVKEVDLNTGASHELFNFSFHSNVFGVTPRAIVGDFLLGILHSDNPKYVLINWRASIFVSLGHADSYSIPKFRSFTVRRHVELIPGHILSTYSLPALCIDPSSDATGGVFRPLAAANRNSHRPCGSTRGSICVHNYDSKYHNAAEAGI